MLNRCALSLVVLALAGLPLQLRAQTTNKVHAEKKATTEKKEGKTEKKLTAHPFHGKLAAVDMTGKTITLGKSTYHITSETIIQKNGKAATLADGVVGDEVSGYAKPTADGTTMAATKVTFGPKPDSKGDSKAATRKSDSSKK